MLVVTRTRLLPADGNAGDSAPPGTLLRRDGEQLVVQCGDGPLALVAWDRPEGAANPTKAPSAAIGAD